VTGRTSHLRRSCRATGLSYDVSAAELTSALHQVQSDYFSGAHDGVSDDDASSHPEYSASTFARTRMCSTTSCASTQSARGGTCAGRARGARTPLGLHFPRRRHSVCSTAGREVLEGSSLQDASSDGTLGTMFDQMAVAMQASDRISACSRRASMVRDYGGHQSVLGAVQSDKEWGQVRRAGGVGGGGERRAAPRRSLARGCGLTCCAAGSGGAR